MFVRGLTLAQLSESEVDLALERESGLGLEMGPFIVRIKGCSGSLKRTLVALYGDFRVVESRAFADFHISLDRPRGLRRRFRPQVVFKLDGRNLFEPFPLDTAFPLFEWGLNWSVAQRSHQFLLLHSACLERSGHGILLPASPGSGKSTLCAAMAHRGWRQLSDEFGIFDLKHRSLVPFPRPIALKNESIEVIRSFAPDAFLGPSFPKTRKGTVAHLRPTLDAVASMAEKVVPRWLVFPKFVSGASPNLHELPKAQAFMRLAHNSFNYEITGADGFSAAVEIVRKSDCYELSYGRLDDAIALLDALT